MKQFVTKTVAKVIPIGENQLQVIFEDGSFVILIVSTLISSEDLSLPVAIPVDDEEEEEEEDSEDEGDEEEDSEDDGEEEEDEEEEEEEEEEEDDDEEDDDEEENVWTKEDIEEMSKEELTTLIEDEDLDVDLDDYPKVKALRKAVIKALEL